jgi:hypothetical protein
MPILIEVMHVTERGSLERGHFLEWFDIEAYDGRGDARVTQDSTKAHRFTDLTAAFETWRSTSKKRPLRPDGRPNRPLTALSVTFRTCDDEGRLLDKEGVGIPNGPPHRERHSDDNPDGVPTPRLDEGS